MKVKSEDRKISEVLTAYFLRVPRFQRPYEWTNSEVEDFWDDVTLARNDYFIGSMVLFPSTHGSQGIVDGQQRITTITLMLCALRDALRATGAVDEAAGLQNLIERRGVLDNQLHFVLQTDEPNAYLRFVQSDQKVESPTPILASERLLRAAYSKLSEKLDAMVAGGTDKAKKSKLLDLRNKLLDLRLITVEVDNEDDATVIFQTLNSRGRDLEAADLVKSHLLSILQTKNPAIDSARTNWNSILSSFEESQADLPMDRFLLHSWLSRYDYLARADLGKTVRKKVRKSASGQFVSASDFLDNLVTDARLYRQINEPTYRTPWQQEEVAIRQAFVALQIFRVRQPLPWLLALWRQYDQKDLRQRDVIPGIETIERYHFISTAVTNQPSSGGASKMYASHARQLTDASDLKTRRSVIDDLKSKLTAPERLPTLEQFNAAFATIRSSRIFTQQQRLALYILQRMHVFVAPVVPDLGQLTVEHLATQASGTHGQVSSAVLATLGNLILIPSELNANLSDLTFGKKKVLLEQASNKGVYIDPFILRQNEWGPDQIAERTKLMATNAYLSVWAI